MKEMNQECLELWDTATDQTSKADHSSNVQDYDQALQGYYCHENH